VLEVAAVGGDAKGAVLEEWVGGGEGRSGIEGAGAGVEAGVGGVGGDGVVAIVAGERGRVAGAPLAAAGPEGGDAVLARGTFDDDIELDLVEGIAAGLAGSEGKLGGLAGADRRCLAA
jgi:hypothetical protein